MKFQYIILLKGQSTPNIKNSWNGNLNVLNYLYNIFKRMILSQN